MENESSYFFEGIPETPPRQMIAIGESPQHRALLHCATADGINAITVRDYLWRIRAPRELLGLARISGRIKLMLSSARIWGIELAKAGMENWPAVVDYIVRNRRQLAHRVGPEFDLAPRSTRDNPFLGRYLTYWAPYPTYWHDHPILDESYVLVQAYLLFAFAHDAQRHTLRSEYEQCVDWYFRLERRNPYDASHAVRILSEDDAECVEMLRQLPVDLAPRDFARALSRVKPPRKKHLARAHEDLRNYLELAYDLRTQPDVRGAGGGGGGKAVTGHVSLDAEDWRTAALAADDDDQFDSHVSYTAVAASTLTPAERRECARHDVCPAEYESTEETVETSIENQDVFRDPSSFATIVAGAANHIEMANQMIWFSYTVPTPSEIAKVIHTWFAALRSRPRPWKPSNDAILLLELVLAGLTMIATGATLEKALGLYVCSSDSVPDDDDLTIVMDETATRAWWNIRAPLPEYQTDQGELDAEEFTEFIKVPDVVHAGWVLRLLLRVREENGHSRPLRLFTQDVRTYRRALRHMLKGIDASERTTIAKLPNFLFAHLVRESDGDVADACFASAYWHDLARVPSFYATPSLGREQRLYVTAANNLRAAVRTAIRALSASTTPAAESRAPRPYEGGDSRLQVRLTQTRLRIGNRLCPTREVTRAAVAAMKNEIRALSRSKDRRDLIRRHNLITLYTLEFFAASVGVRGVTTPYVHLDEVDQITGFTVMREKTVRAAWLPQKMVKQMQLLDKYVQTQTLIQPLPTFGADRSAPCFLIDEHGRALEITPTIKTEYLKEYFPFPANIFRRYIRNELREVGCPASVTKVWISHASRGEETHHIHSHFSLAAQRQGLRHYLLPILNDMGFEPLAIA